MKARSNKKLVSHPLVSLTLFDIFDNIVFFNILQSKFLKSSFERVSSFSSLILINR